MPDIDLATILASGEYLKREGDELVGAIPAGGGGGGGSDARFDVTGFGAVGDDVADDTAAFQACYDAAVAANGVMYIPAPPVAWRLTGPVECYVPGPVVIEGDGPTSLVHMDAFPFAVFDILDAPDHTVRNLRAKGTAGRDATGFDTDGVWRGARLKSYSCLVWSNSSGTVVTDVDVETFCIGVNFTSWDETLDDYGTVQLTGCRFENIEVRDVEFGLLCRSTRDLIVNNVRGNYSLSPGSGTPPHLVYFPAEGPSTTGLNFGSATAFDGTGGKAFQFKNVIDGVVDSLVAENCEGTLVFEDSVRLTVNSVVCHNDVYGPASDNGVVQFFGYSKDCVVRSAMLHTVGEGRVIYTHNEPERCGIENFYVVTNYTAAVGTDDAVVHLQGVNNFARNGKVRCDGVARVGYIAYSGSGHTFDNVESAGTKTGIRIRAATPGCQVINYDRTKLAVTTGQPLEVDGALATYRPRAPVTAQIGVDNVIVYDRFETPRYTNGVLQSASTGQTWTSDAGTWTAVAGRAQCTATGNARIRIEAGSSNVEVEAGVTLSTGGAGLHICSSNTDHLMVWFDTATNTLTLSKRVASSLSTINTVPFTIQPGRRYRLTVHKYVDLVKVYVDGVLYVTHILATGDMTAFGSLTQHGLRSHSTADSRFDNFVIRQLGAGGSAGVAGPPGMWTTAMPRTIVTYTGTAVTAALTDGGNYLRFTGTNPTYTVPPNSTAAFPAGTQIEGIGAATAMTLIQGSGVTITKARTLVTVGAGSGWTLIKTATDTWDLHGDFV